MAGERAPEAHGVPRRPQRGAAEGGGAGRHRWVGAAEPGEAGEGEFDRRPADHGWSVRGVEGVSRGVVDHRRRNSAKSVRNRRPRFDGAGPGRRTAEHGNRGATGDERTAAEKGTSAMTSVSATRDAWVRSSRSDRALLWRCRVQ